MKNVGKWEEKIQKDLKNSPTRTAVLYRPDSHEKLYARQSNNQESLIVKSVS